MTLKLPSLGLEFGNERLSVGLSSVCLLRLKPLLYLELISESVPVNRFSCNSVGFTLSQATKALRESRGIALLYFRPLH